MLVLQEHMVATAVISASAKTMQHVPEKMVPATAHSQGGQGSFVINPALGGTMGSTVLTDASVKMAQLVIERPVSLLHKSHFVAFKILCGNLPFSVFFFFPLYFSCWTPLRISLFRSIKTS